jgi:uncharacterized protein
LTEHFQIHIVGIGSDKPNNRTLLMHPPFLTDDDYDELADWLTRRRTGITDIVELEGFLTALVIGPNTVSPTLWLPKVWGGRTPKFADLAEMNRFVGLVMGLFNNVVFSFEQAAQEFQPTFYESKVKGRRIIIVDEWCCGFLKGLRLDTNGWKPLKRERPELLKPFELFGSRAGWAECEAGGDEQMHRLWSPKVTSAVKDIHAYWIPHRLAQVRRQAGQTTH